MTYYMGIDGGGSTVRVVIVTPDLTICGQSEGPTVNPGVVGSENAANTIRQAMRTALKSANLTADQIAAVGIGVAGAAAYHSADWLRAVVGAVTPQARIVPSADFEIALVGALGQREGVLVLAGTGSLAYGVNAAGETALVGGWGYLLDDAGSGYWIGHPGIGSRRAGRGWARVGNCAHLGAAQYARSAKTVGPDRVAVPGRNDPHTRNRAVGPTRDRTGGEW